MWHRVDKTESFGYRKAFSPTETRGGLAKLASRTLLQILPTIWCRPNKKPPRSSHAAVRATTCHGIWSQTQIEKVATSSCHIDDRQGFRAIDVTLNVFGEVTLLNLLLHLQGGDLVFSTVVAMSDSVANKLTEGAQMWYAEPLPSAPWDLQEHRRNLKQMDCEGLHGCHLYALYLACVSDYIHSCNLRAWQCGSGPAWPTFDISFSFTRAPAKIEWQTNTRCMPCLLIWGFKLSTAGMTLQQYICEYMNMQLVAMRQCACRIRPINFADTVHMCSAWFESQLMQMCSANHADSCWLRHSYTNAYSLYTPQRSFSTRCWTCVAMSLVIQQHMNALSTAAAQEHAERFKPNVKWNLWYKRFR